MTMLYQLLVAFALFLNVPALSPPFQRDSNPNLNVTGRWIGAFVRSGSVLTCHVEIEEAGEGRLTARFWIPEWVWYHDIDPTDITLDPDGLVSFQTVRGVAQLHLDADYMEMIGSIGDAAGETTLHLKRDLPAVTHPSVSAHAISFSSDTDLVGRVFAPTEGGPFPAVVLIHGRGCGGNEGFNGRARSLAQRGIAAVVYDKRGTGDSGGSCDTTTFDELVLDAAAAFDAARAHPKIDADRVAIMGYSAGGWICARLAAERPEIAAVVSVVGPAMSVEAQQRLNGRLTVEGLGFKDTVLARALEASSRYLDLMFEDLLPASEQFAEMMALKAEAERVGWDLFFEETDIPESPETLDQLWVRRFAYDPADDLRRVDQPWLSVLGGTDQVVPPEPNAKLFSELLASSPRIDLRVIPVLGHGAEHGDIRRILGGQSTSPSADSTGERGIEYLKFDRVDHRQLDWPIGFLREVFETIESSAP